MEEQSSSGVEWRQLAACPAGEQPPCLGSCLPACSEWSLCAQQDQELSLSQLRHMKKILLPSRLHGVTPKQCVWSRQELSDGQGTFITVNQRLREVAELPSSY